MVFLITKMLHVGNKNCSSVKWMCCQCMFTHVCIHFLLLSLSSTMPFFLTVCDPFPYVSFQLRRFEGFACCSGWLCADGNRGLLNEAFFFPLPVLIGVPLTDI